LEIVACRGIKLRGQAWVCFETLESATAAMGRMQNHPFFDKPMRIAYSKSPSDVVAKKNGTYKPREKRKRGVPAPAANPAPTAATTPAAAAPAPMEEEVNNPPSNVLFATGLPDGCTADMLDVLFKSHGGFKEVRMVPGKNGIAFVEFDDELKSSTALQALNGFKLTPTDSMRLSFAKR